MNIESLLYCGNKKAKQYRDIRRALINFLYENGCLCLPFSYDLPELDFSEIEQRYQLDLYWLVDNIKANETISSDEMLDDALEFLNYDDNSSEEEREEALILAQDIAQEINSKISDWIEKLHLTLKELKSDISDFYDLKSTIVQKCFRPVGYHTFKGVYSELITQDEVLIYDKEFAFYKGENFSFHVPLGDLDYTVANNLVYLGELPYEVSAEMDKNFELHNKTIANMNLKEIIDILNNEKTK